MIPKLRWNKSVSKNTIQSPFLKSLSVLLILMIVIVVAFTTEAIAQSTQTFTNSGNYSVPSNVTTVTVQCWGAGGGGATRSGSNGRGGGGGGGAFACSTFAVTPGAVLPVIVGEGGSANSDGEASSFGNNWVYAPGGDGANQNSRNGADGAPEALAIGFITHSGGDGGNGSNGGGSAGGGGGGAAGLHGDGGDGSSSSGGNGNGPNSGDGGNRQTGNANGNNGFNYGGGGGGAKRTSGTRVGGSAGNGLVTITPTLWANPIIGTNPSSSLPYNSGNVIHPNISVSGISYGPGLLANTGNDLYNVRGFSTGGLDLNDYFEFTMTPELGYKINFTGFAYSGTGSSTEAPTNFIFRSSLDNFAANIGSPAAEGAEISLAGGLYQGIDEPITFRLYGYSSTSIAARFGINDFFFFGNVSPASSVTSFSPSEGCASGGSTILVNGLNLSTASTVKINGTVATFTVLSNTQLSLVLPAGATSGPIQVSTSLGLAESSTDFIIISAPSQPSNFISSQASICPGGSQIQYTVPNVSGITYNWTYSGIGSTIIGSGNSVNVEYASNATSGTLSVTANNACGISIARSISVSVDPSPVASITPTYCLPDGSVLLTASNGASYLWSTGEVSQSINASQAGLYSVQVSNATGCSSSASFQVATELVTNGSFDAGNSGFTTAYTFVANIAGQTELYPEGTYSVVSNANSVHNFFYGTDRYSGTGNFMVINGDPSLNQAVWSQNAITVQPNTTYYFSAWAMSVVNGNNAILQFSINGMQVGSIAYLPNGYTNTNGPYNWVRFYGAWNSGAATSVNLSIVNLNTATGGNDFALDDISFATLAPIGLTSNAVYNGGASACEGNPLFLTANISGGASPFAYLWSGPNSFSSSLANPTVSSSCSPANSGTYQLVVTDALGCTFTKNVVVNVNSLPAELSISPAVSPVCTGRGTDIEIALSQTGHYYQLLNAATLDEVGSPLNGNGSTLALPTGDIAAATNFTVRATSSANGCSKLFSTQANVATVETPVLFTTNQAACSGTADLTSPVVTAGSTGGGILTYFTQASSQTIYSEDFNGQNGKGVAGSGLNYNLSGVTWTIDGSNANLTNSSDYLQVVSNQMEGVDTDGPIYWFSPMVNIANYSEVGFSINASESGNMENNDYIRVEYRIDGGNWITADINGYLNNDFSSETISQSGLFGNTLEIRITIDNNNGSEKHRFDNVIVSGIGLVPLANPNSVGSGIYYIQSTSGSCFDLERVEVVISTNPSATFAYTESPYCSSGINPVPVISGSAGVFSAESGLVFSNPGTGEIDLNASTPGAYTVTNTISPTGGCPAVSYQNTITITQKLIASFQYGGNNLCQSANATPVDPEFINGGIAGAFSSSSDLVVIDALSGTIDVGNTLPGNYAIINLLPPSGGCASVIDTAFITINPYTFEGSVSSSTGIDELCAGEPVQLFASGTSYLSALLQENFNGSLNNWTTVNSSTGGDIDEAEWTLRLNNYNQSETFRSNDDSQFYLSDSREQNGDITSTQLISPSMSTIGYSSLQLNFWHYYNYDDEPAEAAKVEVSINGVTWTTVATYTSNEGSSTSFANESINLNSYTGSPIFYVRFNYYAGDRARYWAIDNVSISGQTINYSYDWISSPAGAVSNIQSPVFYPNVNTSYILTAANTFGCESTVTPIPVTVKPVPQLTSPLNPDAICSGETFSYNPSSTIAGSQYTWIRPFNADINDAGVNTPQVGAISEQISSNSNSSVAVYYTVSSSFAGCSSSEIITLNVHPKPQVTVSGDVTICNGSGTTLSAIVTGATGSVSYSWLPSTGLDDASVVNPFANPSVAVGSYRVVVTDANTCTDTSAFVNITNAGFGGTHGLWTGASNSDWNNCENWSDGRIPEVTSDVVVNEMAANDLEITGIVHVSSLLLSSTGSNEIKVKLKPGSQLTVDNDLFINKISGSSIIKLEIEANASLYCGAMRLAGSALNSQDAVLKHEKSTSVCVVNGDLTINSGGLVDLSDNNPTTADGILHVQGNFLNNASVSDFNVGESRLILNGSGDQMLRTNANRDFHELMINKSNGSKVYLENDITVKSKLFLNSGLVHLNGNTLNLGSADAAVSIFGGDAMSYIVANSGTQGGFVNHIVPAVGQSYFFPIGDSLNYSPFEVLLNQANLDSARIRASLTLAPHPAFGTESHYLTRYWSIEPSGISNANYDVEYQYSANDVVGADAMLFPAKYNSGGWQSCIESASNAMVGSGFVNTSTKTLQWSGITTFSDFTAIGSGIALPIELLDFTAEQFEDHVDLKWITSSEINNSHFIIERSIDTKLIDEIARVEGAGNSNTIRTYSTIDLNPMEGISYYRLKQVDFNGDFSHSEWVAVNYSGSNHLEIEAVYCDKANGYLLVRCSNPTSDKVVFNLIDASGRLITTYSPGGVSSNWNGSIPSQRLRAGSYILRFDLEGKSAFKKFVIQ